MRRGLPIQLRCSSAIELRKPYFRAKGHLPCFDFNKEIIPPGAHAKYPNGVVGLRVDDDFFAVAALPYRYRNVPTGELVRKLWPRLRRVRHWKPSYNGRYSIAWKCGFSWASYWAQNKDFYLSTDPKIVAERERIKETVRLMRERHYAAEDGGKK